MGNIVDMLKRQHKELMRISDLILQSENPEVTDTRKVYAHLLDFKYLLKEHLELENNIFYPQLLEKIKDKNIGRYHETKDFVVQMKEIEELVNLFLEKYDNCEKIEHLEADFYRGFEEITGVLALRISSEENGVYLLW